MTQEQQDEINKMVEDLMTSPEARERVKLVLYVLDWAEQPEKTYSATEVYRNFLYDELSAKLNGPSTT